MNIRNTSRASNEDIERIRNQQRNHFRNTVLAAIYQDVPTKVIQSDTEEDDVLAQFSGVQPQSSFVERIKDYDSYHASGFNPEVQQVISFETYHINEKSGKEEKRKSVRHLAPQDDQNTGNILTPLTHEDGKPVWEDGRQVMDVENPIGRWDFEPAKANEVEIKRKQHYAVVDEQQHKISSGKIHIVNGDKFAYVQDVDPMELDPNLKAPVKAGYESELAQVMQIGDRYFAHRNFAGWLTLSNERGERKYAIMNCDESTIQKNRAKFNVKANAWEAMSADQRKSHRQNRSLQVPRNAGFEAYVVNQDGVLNRKDNFFIECEKTDNGYEQIFDTNE